MFKKVQLKPILTNIVEYFPIQRIGSCSKPTNVQNAILDLLSDLFILI